MNCVFIGDSIAVGVAQHRPECLNQAQVGRNTDETIFKIGQIPRTVEHVIVSVGSNDHFLYNSVAVCVDNFEKLRVRLGSKRVTWLLLNNNDQARQATQIVARYHGDQVLDIRPFVGPDGVHPTVSGYKTIAFGLK